ncbi:hypothetical protein L873DRAFT_1902185 [Choiromyces venosus 120613-1]|uniref:Uncharacterized protein n=1 Tax=Choiromyces venosus 120613-1 TaxID=1336337 RepID=A0A3N4IRJ9_9PEZI|nr:hypothetical protein L873DRAFT_1902185 [Choiromyces venosus 120613-1]
MESDIDIIQEGTTMAYDGDAAVYAVLYEGLNRRCNPSAFKELYGIHHADMVKINELTSLGDKETINILNIHTEVQADSHRTGTDKFSLRFAEFVQLFQGSGCDECYSTTGLQWVDVACAYQSILECQRYEDST